MLNDNHVAPGVNMDGLLNPIAVGGTTDMLASLIGMDQAKIARAPNNCWLTPEQIANVTAAQATLAAMTPEHREQFVSREQEKQHAYQVELIAEHNRYLDDLALLESFGEITDMQSPLTDAERELILRKIAARKDAAMLGDSGYERIEADAYFTPPENVDCLLEHVTLHKVVWEPACGDGAISQRLIDYGHEVFSSDLYDYGMADAKTGLDFLTTTSADLPIDCRAIVTNPPYGDMVEKFIRHALMLMKPVRGQVAMFLRNEYDASKGRMDLFSLPPFHKKIIVTKRPRWVVGSTGSPRHTYAWYVWDFRQTSGHGSISYSHPDFAPSPIVAV